MTKTVFFLLLISGLLFSSACESENQKAEEEQEEVEKIPENPTGKVFIAGETVALESVLRSIPAEFIDKARKSFHVAYQHTSHGTHVSRGLFGLPHFENGDDVRFAITNNNRTENRLDFYDNVLAAYAPSGVSANDLSSNERAFIQTTRNYLDDPKNNHINVIMWSWCNIAGHNVKDNYLPGMEALISEYGPGGTKIGSGSGKRTNAVHFIFMTGHAVANNNIGEGRPKNQADLIIDYCNQNKLFCLDYYSIDTHDMDGNYWDDASDDGASTKYGGNFFKDWQSSHTLGEDYFENLKAPNGSVAFGAHNSQHITANRKAFAMWWILARIAGWDGEN